MIEAWQRIFPGEEAVGRDLLARWSEPHRRYHTLQHLSLMLGVIDAHAGLADDADAVRLAAWFHDAVYEVFAPDNEARSAELALTALGSLGFAPERAAEVARLVRLTAGHAVEPGDRNGALLADADLAILAGDPPDYARYAAAVREEYAAVPDEVFRPGRAAILRKLADLPELFRVVPARTEWSARARVNLEAEIATLLGAP
ncbi:HD domain-containing protein [Dactylosporangium darangshiense]|uniref:Metal-dependent phosphohydrolase n=1 Tax=Dactylosporangium darangshiense TaxID=579108 RepID=A0ABP8D469_9ACTN